jgi:hypothetical protein
MIMKWWRKRQRAVDMNILWPSCKNESKNLVQAKAAFYYHVINDTAWTKDYTEAELANIVDELE